MRIHSQGSVILDRPLLRPTISLPTFSYLSSRVEGVRISEPKAQLTLSLSTNRMAENLAAVER